MLLIATAICEMLVTETRGKDLILGVCPIVNVFDLCWYVITTKIVAQPLDTGLYGIIMLNSPLRLMLVGKYNNNVQ